MGVKPHREKTHRIYLGSVPVGAGAFVSIQTMTTLPALDVDGNLDQISNAAALGCDVVRVSLREESEVPYFAQIVKRSKLPVVADIHFHYRLAISALESNAAAIRVNPGNLGGKSKFIEVLKAAKDLQKPIRIGVNSGSLPSDIAKKHGADIVSAMMETVKIWLSWAESEDFSDIKVSLKSSSVFATVEANRLYAKEFFYPLHIGLTESGFGDEGLILSSAAVGALLLDGIGDTVRISLSGGVEQEVLAARRLLVGLGLRKGVRIIACPGCGRQHFVVDKVARYVESKLASIDKNLTVSVMGCEVNGPGEALLSDFGIVGANFGFILYHHGNKIIKSNDINEVIDFIIHNI